MENLNSWDYARNMYAMENVKGKWKGKGIASPSH
jgi:hypothetical protein